MSRVNLANRVHNGADTLDSRDVIERIDELQTERMALREELDATVAALAADENDSNQEAKDAAYEALEDWCRENDNELTALLVFAEEASGSPDWRHGETLIRDSYFEDYAQELAEDCGMVQKGATWPNNCIDWEEAADQLKQYYFSVDFDGVTYWIRS